MDHIAALVPLDPSGHAEQAAAQKNTAKLLKDRLPDDDVGDPGLVLERHEDDAARRARLLAHQNKPGNLDPSPIRELLEIATVQNPPPVEPLPKQGDRMRLQRQAEMLIILAHLLGKGERREDD